MSFATAVSGINAANADLGVISNNIANSNTTGYKESRAEFADLFYTANGTGHGTRLAAVAQQFRQGGVNATDNPLDMAVSGEGFFRLSDNGNAVYTRAGAFGMDREGYIVNNQNLRLTGYVPDPNGGVGTVLGDLRVDPSQQAPNPTGRVDYGLNLAADADEIDTTANPFDPADPASYNFTSAVTVYDSLGADHTLTAYFVRPDATVNDWEVHFTLDGGVPFNAANTPPTPTTYGPQTLSFDTAGALAPGAAPINLTGVAPGNAAAAMDLTLDFATTTQFGGQFTTQSLTQDGHASGQFAGVEVAEDGTVFGRYDNGQRRALGQVALANFANPQGLTPVGDTAWLESGDSGPPLLGTPGQGRLGELRGGALEGSNVDLTEALVNMISAQRNFQANAQMISTNDALTQTIINLR